METFRIAVAESALDDLYTRLDRTRLVEPSPAAPWAQGAELHAVADLVDHWRNRYDWRRTEAEINQWPQFMVEAAGQRIHVLHARCDDANALPLVLIHGWPGSIVEFLDCIEALRARWHVVVVSMPGYGFSGPTRRTGVDVTVVAAAVADAMTQIGYPKFVAQGGDWGALVTRQLGETHADQTLAIHVNMMFAPPPAGVADPMAMFTPTERARFDAASQRIAGGIGYMGIQGTKPDVVGVALDDSPVGLGAWILEKFHAWTDSRDGMPITIDRLIDNLMMYWWCATATSAGRLYCESSRAGTGAMSAWEGRVTVPTGHAVYPYELLQTPRAWADGRYPIVHWSEQPKGGHFAAFEQPELFCADLSNFRDALG